MLQDLVDALKLDPTLGPPFAADPTPLFDLHNVPQNERDLVLKWDETRLILLLGFADFEVLQAAFGQRDFILYPGFAKLKITKITAEPANAATIDLLLWFTWDHPGVPEHGLPAWFLVRVFDENSKEIQEDTRYAIPTLLDLWTQSGRIRRTLTTPAPGNYTVVLDCGNPELRESVAFPITL